MILADIASLEAIDARLRDAGGPDAIKASEEIRLVLYAQDKSTEQDFYRLLSSVWGSVTSALDRQNYNLQRESDLRRLERELSTAVMRHRTSGAPVVLIREPGVNDPEA